MALAYRGLRTPTAKTFGLLACLLLTLAAALTSTAFGQTLIPLATVIDALVAYDGTRVEHIIIHANRLNRVAMALVVGSSLAVSGALMQAMTRNALASPSLMGLNAGALLMIVIGLSFLSLTSLMQYVWLGLLGAALAAALVYLLAAQGREGFAGIRIVLAGAATTALFVSFTQGVLITHRESLQGVLFWLGGSVSNRSLDLLLPVLPLVAFAWLITASLVRPLNLLMLDDETARGLGQNLNHTRLWLGLDIVILAGTAVALAGLIGFIGLITPHLARGLFGRDHRWLLPAAAMIGASLLLLADTLSRFIMPPQEVPVGVLTALLGVPFFIAVARRSSPAL
ncbi:MAG: FecCD family ABC transporter permease [Saccharospirillum sp.]